MTYCFICPMCDEKKEIIRRMVDSCLPELCECGKQMERDWQTERTGVRGDYNEPIVSDSMAFDARDLDEHRKRFPDVEVVVDHDRSARPVLTSLTQKRKYLRARGWIDCNSFTG